MPISASAHQTPAEARGAAALPATLRRLYNHPILEGADEAEAVAAYQLSRNTRRRPTTNTQEDQDEQEDQTEQDERVAQILREGEHAAEKLLGSMFRLIALICREQTMYRQGNAGAFWMLDDLMSEAFVVVLEAAARFDPGRGPAFHTWASARIRDHVRTLVTSDSAVALKSTSSWDRMHRLASIEQAELRLMLGRRPTMAELSTRLMARCLVWAEEHLTPAQRKLPAAEREELKTAKLRKQGMLSALENLDRVLAMGYEPLRLDESAEGPAPHELVAATEAEENLSEGTELAELRGTLVDALRRLRPRECHILLYRYGFADGDEWTYPQIAELFGITAERVRQIERRVLEQLSADPELAKRMASHLNGEGEGGCAGNRTRYATRADLMDFLRPSRPQRPRTTWHVPQQQPGGRSGLAAGHAPLRSREPQAAL